jgi:hypothetical protein
MPYRPPRDDDRVSEHLPLPDFVNWPIFPFEGDLRVKEPIPDADSDMLRAGEGDRPCPSCGKDDDEYLWVDDRWRVISAERLAVPALFLESRDHLDLDDLDDDMASELGRLTVRLDRAFLASGGIGRTHVNRWGDGGSHLHLWFYGRPVGSIQLLGFGMPMWAQILPPLPQEEWDRRLLAVAEHLAAGGGTLIGNTDPAF